MADNETTLSFTAPAPLVNRFTVSIQDGVARLGFLEVAPDGGEPHLRGAVSMSLVNLASLGELIAGLQEKLAVGAAPAHGAH